MTYNDLLKETAIRKQKVIAEINAALKGPCGFLLEAEIKREPGKIAWHYLAKEFCEKLADHAGEFIDQAGGVNTFEAHEIGDICMAYENDDSDLYSLLPIEAQLFEKE